jgi:hypothetical protein
MTISLKICLLDHLLPLFPQFALLRASLGLHVLFLLFWDCPPSPYSRTSFEEQEDQAVRGLGVTRE